MNFTSSSRINEDIRYNRSLIYHNKLSWENENKVHDIIHIGRMSNRGNQYSKQPSKLYIVY